MSNPEIKFVVSTPCNLNNEASGYRLIQLKDKKLSSLPINNYQKLSNSHQDETTNNDNLTTDIGITTQAFCYLKPQRRNFIPESQIVGIMDYSDYMIISKSSGLIEIIRDYQYKLAHNLLLKPDFVLACIPNEFNAETVNDFVTVGLEYKSGLLYCCQSNGDIYVFILNLPVDYIQWDNLFDLNDLINPEDIPIIPTSATLDTIKQQTYIEDSEDVQARQITDFFRETQYTGRSKLKHICYYLTPFLYDGILSSNKKSLLSFMRLYKDQYIYRPSICINLEQGISHFHINPLDKLSFLTGSQFNPIMIRKIILPMTYLNYLITYTNMKKRVQEKYQMEIIPWEQIALENGFNSFELWIECEAVYGFESVSTNLWDNIRNDGGTGYLKSAVVWKQSLNHTNDKTYEQLYRNIGNIPSQTSVASTSTGSSTTITTSTPISSTTNNGGLSRTNSIRRSAFSGITHRNGTELPESWSWQLNAFLRNLQKNNALSDFSVVDTNSFNNIKSTSSSSFPLLNDNIPPIMSNLNNMSYRDSEDLSSNISYIIDPPQINPNYDHGHTLHNLTPSFLTDKYKTMDIIRIDKSLVFSVFKPKFQDEEITKIDLFCHRNRQNFLHETLKNNNNENNKSNERIIFGKALPNLSSFKKIFRLTKSLCLIVDISGLLLIDLDNIGEGIHNLDNMNANESLLSAKDIENNLAIRLSIFDIGLVNDAIVVMESFDLEPDHHIMKLNVITTCLPGEIKAFEVEFDSNHIMGYTVLQDCLRLTNVDRFTDKMALLDCNIKAHDTKKRKFSSYVPKKDVTNTTKPSNNLDDNLKRFKPNP